MDGKMKRNSKHYECEQLDDCGPGHRRLRLDTFMGRYFMYGRYGAIHVEGYLPDPGVLVVRAVTSGEVIHVVPVMLENRRELDGMEVVAWMAR